MSDNSVIEFDNNPDGIFYAGQIVTGSVTLQSTQTKGVNAINLSVTGYAQTNWSDDNRVNYSGHEDYMNAVINLNDSKYAKNSSHNNNKPLTYNYKFAFQIPLACPTSFEGKTAHIRYKMTVKLLRHWSFNDKFTRNFTVLNVTDVRCDNPLLYLPAMVESTGPFTEEPLKMTISIPQIGYAPGQTIPVNLRIHNTFTYNVTVKLSLIMDICFDIKNVKTKYPQCITLAKTKTKGVPWYCTRIYELIIPATPPSCMNLCNVMKITYRVEVNAKTGALAESHRTAIPIKIIYLLPTKKLAELTAEKNDHMDASGSNSSVDKNSTFFFQAKLDALEGDVQQDEQGCNSNTELPPPSFEEAMVLNSTHTLTAVSSKQLSGCTDTAPPTYKEATAQNMSNINEQPYDTELSPSEFEEALHLRATTEFVPKYPVYKSTRISTIAALWSILNPNRNDSVII